METKVKRGWKFRLFVYFLVLTVVALTVYILQPRTYTATGYIQILSHKPYFIYGEGSEYNKPPSCETFVNTQFALMKSPLIIEKNLENPDIAGIPIILKQKDKTAWLAKNLKLQRLENSEIVTVSFSAYTPEDAEKIVNAVIAVFFDYYALQTQDWNIRLLTQLNLELNRQKATARLLQEEIRVGLEAAAQQGQSSQSVAPLAPNHWVAAENIHQEIYRNELKIDFLVSELKMIKEFAAKQVLPSQVQAAVESNPALRELQEKKKELQHHAELVKDFTVQNGDSEPTGYQDQIGNFDREIEKKYAELVETKKNELQISATEKQEQLVLDKEMEIRTLEIYINQLRQKYKEQMRDIANRTVSIVDVSFQQDQLKRVNAILDQLEKRIVAIETERNALPQIELKRKAVRPIKADGLW